MTSEEISMTTNRRPLTAIMLAGLVLALDPAGANSIRAQDHGYTCVNPPCGGTPRPPTYGPAISTLAAWC